VRERAARQMDEITSFITAKTAKAEAA
jgi:hypothetical protein